MIISSKTRRPEGAESVSAVIENMVGRSSERKGLYFQVTVRSRGLQNIYDYAKVMDDNNKLSANLPACGQLFIVI
jgi:hypothetical protein